MAREFTKVYDPKRVEAKIYRRWERSGFFDPDRLPRSHRKPFGKAQGKPFTIIMPPPNANAPMHIGHAVFVTLQDIMIRFWRMRGRKTLWLPGADHAGFETQVVFDKKLEKQGRRRSDIPRDELYRQMLDFTLENKKVMERQLRKLGASCDWSREKFTLDSDIVKIVTDTFIKLYEDGLLYRGERMVNWCVKHQTTLSDLEVKYEEREDSLYYLKYGPFEIATARPETKFGDKYVVMHPEDKRYVKYKDGEKLQAEWINGQITAAVLKDKVIDMKFGTGVMTITPAHDPIDFELAERRKLEREVIIDRYGKLLPIAGEFAGMKASEARPKIVEKLKSKGLLSKIDQRYKHNVAVCYKCGTVVEPLVMPQWFVRMTAPPHAQNQKSKIKNKKLGKSLRDVAVEAVSSGRIQFIPKRYEKVFFHWMRNLRDWNISRQIVWGIRIPAWYDMTLYENRNAEVFFQNGLRLKKKYPALEKSFKLNNVGPHSSGRLHADGTYILESASFVTLHWYVRFRAISWQEIKSHISSVSIPATCKPVVGGKIPESAIQDPDVLDTWFSSGQWPFATLLASGRSSAKRKAKIAKLPWATRDFERFYPTDVMETGYDILFFWVARMIMLGFYCTGKVPFRTVYLHGLVRDKDRQKMSKSKGNVVDPLGVAELYGTDAVRMALIIGNTAGSDIIISEEKIRGYRNFSNKLWNIHRFIMLKAAPRLRSGAKIAYSREDERQLAELRTLTKQVTADLERFRFHHAAEALYHYTWHTFADKIIESAKPRFASANPKDRAAAQSLLLEIHSTLLALLHPFMPFITEELWQNLQATKATKVTKETKGLLMVEPWPR